MTSPYLQKEASKLRLVHAARAPIAGAHADHDPNSLRFPRSQREAGIEHLEWEERLPAIRPWMFFALSAACWGILGLALAWTLSVL